MNKITIRTLLLLIVLLLAIPFTFNQDRTNAASLYTDIKNDFWAYSSIEWATKTGIMQGYPNGTFGPHKEITESQLVSVLSKFDTSYKAISPFVAKKNEDSASGYYRYFKSKNIPLNGYTNTKIRGKGVTRGQFARILAAVDGYDLTETYAVQYLYTQNLSTGTNGKKTYEDFKPARTLTRVDATVFLNRIASRGKFSIKGLRNAPSGQDNVASELPSDFPDTGTIVFPSPNDEPVNIPSSTHDVRIANLDIESPTLIANGVDTSFITLILKDCYGNSISYDETIPFVVTSKSGAIITNEEGRKVSNSPTIYTDGADLTAEITSLKSAKTLVDTISFRVSDNRSNDLNLACYRTPVKVQISYVPKAELRIEHVVENNYKSPSVPKDSPTGALDNFSSYVTVKASIVRPGGQIISDYKGKVVFNSPQFSFTNNEVSFVNGVAYTTIYSNTSGNASFTARVSEKDPRYSNELSSVVNKTHSHQVQIDRPLMTDFSCPRNFEVGFIIDSSGSMKRSDPDKLRISKSQELISAINASTNIGAHFNSKGHFLAKGPTNHVRPTFVNIGQSGGTNILDGLDIAIDKFSNDTSPKIAILITDGKSNTSKILSILKKAQSKNIKIYTIGLGNASQLNEYLLAQIANSTGGSYYNVKENVNLVEAYQSILDEVTCETYAPGCSPINQGFISPTIKLTKSSFYMNTFIDIACGDIKRVIVRFTSLEGEVDYELIYRGQNNFALEKRLDEIIDLSLFSEGLFLSYDGNNNLVGMKEVTIQ